MSRTSLLIDASPMFPSIGLGGEPANLGLVAVIALHPPMRSPAVIAEFGVSALGVAQDQRHALRVQSVTAVTAVFGARLVRAAAIDWVQSTPGSSAMPLHVYTSNLARPPHRDAAPSGLLGWWAVPKGAPQPGLAD